MTSPHTAPPESIMANRRKHRSVSDAFTATQIADVAIESCKPECTAEIWCALNLLDTALSTVKSSRLERGFDFTILYASARVLADLASMSGRPRLSDLALSLCKMLADQNTARHDAISIHIEAILFVGKNDQSGDALLPLLSKLHDTQMRLDHPSIETPIKPHLS